MYYKITNTECDVYKRLHELRDREICIDYRNLAAIRKEVELDFIGILGKTDQSNCLRTNAYYGFKFADQSKVNLKIWKEDVDHEGIFIPNKRTKLGRQMNSFLRNGLEGSWFEYPLEILGVHHKWSRFMLPFVEISGEAILIRLDDKMEPKDENVIEITKKEFFEILHA